MNRLRTPSPALVIVRANANGMLVVTRGSTGAATVDRPFHLTVSW
jgi:hypothetical protein